MWVAEVSVLQQSQIPGNIMEARLNTEKGCIKEEVCITKEKQVYKKKLFFSALLFFIQQHLNGEKNISKLHENCRFNKIGNAGKQRLERREK